MRTEGDFTYSIDNKKVTPEEFYLTTCNGKYILNIDDLHCNAVSSHLKYVSAPFFLDEVVSNSFSPQKNEKEILEELRSKPDSEFKIIATKVNTILAEKEKIDELRNHILTSNKLPDLSAVLEAINAETEEELEDILKRNMNIGAPDWNQNDTGGTVFERLQDHPLLSDYLGNTTVEFKIIDLSDTLPPHPTKEQLGKAMTECLERACEVMVGKKEIENKLDYSEINLELLDLMAKRFSANKIKYPKGNMKKYIEKDSLLWAAYRHLRKMLQPIENDTETYEDHLAAVSCNMSMVLDQLKNK